MASGVVSHEVDEEAEHRDHQASHINDLKAILEDPSLAVDEDKPAEAHQGSQVVSGGVLPRLQFLEVQLLEDTLELVVEGQNEAESFNEVVDFGFEFGIFKVDLPDDVLEIEYKLIKVVMTLESLCETEANPTYLFALNYPPITLTLYITCDFSLRKKAHFMAT